ncbi:sigma-54-dependent Fis family transcriptional regulator [Marinoscillum sp. MHG1-6]|uniref:sigma-54 interaction domain-containing protein n=1 Tax=Marinoscillum sp. MHG1-6 TaxID=2959627 RepID=UPI002158609C|nr:sigma-54 dependent transcriptional regulator [Marinoscillum sp. MHG1-6]
MDYRIDSETQSIKQRFEIIGNSPKLNYAIRVAMQVAPTDMSVLITGESGAGKESFSKIIHSLSPRKHGQFIAINCGAIPEGTIDSELFGHEKGSFTGAHEARKGYFEVTNGGTIFLDEIGEMPTGTQARLLRVLENGEFIKVGSSKVQKTDVRVIAATNVNLLEAVNEGKFREDLYYRLNTVPIYVPALRERDEDILLLFRKFASDFSETYRTKPIVLDKDAQALILNYRFPGNIRQLKNLVEQMSVLEIERNIDADTLRKYLPENRSSLPALINKSQGSGSSDFSERDILYKVLFDLKKDVTDMKELVLKMLQGDTNKSEILSQHKGLFNEIDSYENSTYEEPEEGDKPAPILINAGGSSSDDDSYEIEDITHETEDEDSLSLEKQEKEMILRALAKNKNKRKYAAQDLGISERTLYRKIKQYEIDNK